MRLIPGKTKVQIELFKGITLSDLIVAGGVIGLITLALYTDMPGKLYVAIGLLAIGAALIFRLDSEPTYMYILHMFRHFAYQRSYRKKGISDDTPEGAKKQKHADVKQLMPYTGINDGYIEYGNKYFASVIEIPPVEFRFFSQHRRDNSIENGVGRVLRAVHPDLGCNIVKLERPIIYDEYRENETAKLDELKKSYEQGVLGEEEMKSRVDVVYDRIGELNKLCDTDKVVESFYYLVLFGENPNQLSVQTESAMDYLRNGEMNPKRLNDKELAVFLKYSNEIDFDEREIDKLEPEDYLSWAMPDSVDAYAKTVEVNHIITHNMRVVNYPSIVGNAWMASVMSLPGTKVVVKCRPADNQKAIRGIDRALQELRGQYMATSIDSKLMEIQEHIDTLSTLLAMLQGDNEILLDTNVYVTLYDIKLTREWTTKVQPPESIRSSMLGMKKNARRAYQEASLKLAGMDFNQVPAFIGSQISAYDPLVREGRGIPTNTIAAMYPWIFAYVSDKKGFKLGTSDGVPVFIDFFRRDSERVNSNMVIVGKSGSGKSYATKSLLTNLAADDSKIFILDPENEYADLAENLHGKFINVGNAQYGRLNPFHIITSLDDDDIESGDSGSYATHLQFLEEFFKQILPDCEKDALEYLNSMVDRMYYNRGITPETDLAKLRPEDYPIFDDLYDEILQEFQQTDNEYIRRMLRTLVNYIAKFSTGGRNANIWNGPSTVTTEENFTVFNFQSLLANRNGAIANAQMLLVLKYVDNEIIKNRDYNTRYGRNRKIVVVIDEAHVFIDTKYPVALDFMFQLAKRIRKYNGMQIVITQNIKDFVGSEEIARKSTAIINACQYSFIFALSPNDMDDLCKLYSKAGGINEAEQEQIIGAARGQAFTIMSPTSRSSFKVVVPDNVVDMFQKPGYTSAYFTGVGGDENWEDFVGDSRDVRETVISERRKAIEEAQALQDELRRSKKSKINLFEEISEEELKAEELKTEELKTEELVVENTKAEKVKAAPESETADVKPAEKEVGVSEKTIDAVDFNKAITEIKDAIAHTDRATAGNANEELAGVMTQLNAIVENMSKLNYENIMQNVSRMIEEKTGEESRTIPAQKEILPQFAAVEENTEANALGSIFDGLSDEQEENQDYYDADTSEEDVEVTDLLEFSLSTLKKSSAIDVMIIYDDMTMQITIEELAEHIAIHNIR